MAGERTGHSFDAPDHGYLTMSNRDETIIFGWGDTRDEAVAMAQAQFRGVQDRYKPRTQTRKLSRADYDARLTAFRAKQASWAAGTVRSG